MEEKEIDLLDLFFEIVKHWRGLIIYMILGALAFASVDYLKNDMAWSEAREEASINYSDEEITDELIGKIKVGIDLTDTAKMAVMTVIDDEAELATRQKYMEKSVLMKMDPYRIPRVEMVYELSQTNGRENHMLGNLYKDVLYGVGLYDWIEKQTQMDATTAKELISITVRTNADYIDDNGQMVLSNDSMMIVIMHSNKDACLKMTQAFKEYMSIVHQELSETMGKHDLELISEKEGFVMDAGVLDKQISARNGCISLQNTIAKAVDAFSIDQEYYYNLLTGVEKEDFKAHAEISVKMLLLGALVFAFLYSAIWGVIYVLNNKLRVSDDLSSLYKITFFGVVNWPEKTVKKRCFIDRSIDNMQKRHLRNGNPMESLHLVTTALKLVISKKEVKELTVLGCQLDAGADKVCAYIKEVLEKDQIKVHVLDNVLTDAEAMEQLETTKAVVLVEKAGITSYTQLKDELELLKRQEIPVLGGIILDEA